MEYHNDDNEHADLDASSTEPSTGSQGPDNNVVGEAALAALVELVTGDGCTLSPSVLPAAQLQERSELWAWARQFGVPAPLLRALVREGMAARNAERTAAAALAAAAATRRAPVMAAINLQAEAAAQGVSVGTMAAALVQARHGVAGDTLLQLALEASAQRPTAMAQLILAGRWTDARVLLRVCPAQAHLRSRGDLPLHLACRVRRADSGHAHERLVAELLHVFPAASAMRSEPELGRDRGHLPLELCFQGAADSWPLALVTLLLQHRPSLARQLPRALRARPDVKYVLDPLVRVCTRPARQAARRPTAHEFDKTYHAEPADFFANLLPEHWATLRTLRALECVPPADVAVILRWAATVRQQDQVGGPLTPMYRQIAAAQGEDALAELLNKLGFRPDEYETEAQLRERGCRTTPDVLFKEPVAFPGCDEPVRFIEVKAGWLVPGLTHADKQASFVAQIAKYKANFGPGIVLWRYGFCASVTQLTPPAVIHVDYATLECRPSSNTRSTSLWCDSSCLSSAA